MSQNVDSVVNPENEVKRIKPIRAKMLVCCLVAMQLLLIAIIVFLLYLTQSCSPVNEKNICRKAECYNTAARIIDSINFNHTPCENFYEYACGRMVPEVEDSLDIFAPKYLLGKDKPQFLKKFHRYYESCLIHEDKFDYQTRVQNTKSLIERIGSIRINKNGDMDFNLTEFVANMILYDSMPLFDVDIDVNPNDSKYILKLMLPDQTSINLGHWYSLSETKRKCLRETQNMSYGKSLNTTLLYNAFLLCQKNYADYLDSISTTMQELDFFPNMTEKEVYGRIRDVRIFIEFEILSKFDEIPLPPNLQEQKIKRNFINVKVSYLERKFPMIQWEVLFKLLTNKDVTNETVIQLYNREYFEDVFRELSEEKHGPLNNAFLAILANSLFENTILPSHRHSREEHCKQQSKDLMPDIVNYLYKVIIKSEVIKKKNEIITKMFEDLKKKFADSLQSQEWLDEETKTSINRKLSDLKLVLFEKGDLEYEKKYLETAYENLDILKDEYQHNHFDLLEFVRRQFLSLHGDELTPENMYRYFVDPTKEEPVFFYPSNSICIPYGLMKQIRDDLPEYLIQSRVGFKLAKIIGHAFDSIGIHYGVNLSQEVENAYKNFTKETRDSLNLVNPIYFDRKRLYFNLNNDLSESDRIADNTAMRLVTESFPTFKNYEMLPMVPQQFTRRKLFFLYLVQGLCRKMKVTDFMVDAFESPVLPPQLRVANLLGNSKEFARTFACKPGNGMLKFGRNLQFPYLT